MHLETMSIDELKTLQQDVEKAIATFETRRLQDARAKLEATAQEMGFKLSELVELPKKGKTINPPKYRHRENPDMTWTGRGRRPGWIVEALERGERLEDYEI